MSSFANPRPLRSVILVLLLVALGSDTFAEPQRRRPVRRDTWFHPGDPVDPVVAFAWPESLPEEQGFDPEMLAAARQEASHLSYLYSLLVIRNGHLVSENYYNGASRRIAYNNYSVSKSITSILVGVALDRGFLQSIDQRLLDILPEYVTPGLDPRKRDINIRHLLMMRAGFEWDDVEASFDELYASPNPIQYIIDMPLADDPGARFNYCTPQTDLLAVVLERVTGMTTREFAEQYLFDPLGVAITGWGRDVQGHYFGGHGMYFTPRNLARFGQLTMNGGVVDGRRLVSPGWIRESIDPSAHFYPWGPVREHGYGYQWWLGEIDGHELYFAAGIGGQYIFCFPELDLIVVTTANMWSWEFQDDQLLEILYFVSEHLLPAVVTDSGVAKMRVDPSELSPTRGPISASPRNPRVHPPSSVPVRSP